MKDSDMMFYAAFGANTDIEGMSHRCPDAKLLGKCVIQDYSLAFKYHADIEPSAGDSVEVVVWEISTNDLKRLDHFEGYPFYYLRKTVDVQFEGKVVQAVVYYMTDETRLSAPSPSYLQLLRTGYQQNGLNLGQIDKALAEIDWIDYLDK